MTPIAENAEKTMKDNTGHNGGDENDSEESVTEGREVERVLGALAMAAIFLISIVNVIVRYATDASFAFTEEYSVFLLVFLTFVGTGLAFARNAHIRIGFFAERFGPAFKRVCTIASRIASLIMFALIAWYGALLAWDEYQFEEVSAGLGYPAWIYTAWMPLLSIAIILRILQMRRGGRS